jgi:hypothetical protein
MSAVKTSSDITIDGKDNEEGWAQIDFSAGFSQTVPNPGAPSSQKTEVKILYDNENIYVFAKMYEVSFDSITKTLSVRDDEGNADLFGIVIDTYGASTSGFGFLVTAAGVQIDEVHAPNSIDRNWNAVWESATNCYDNMWVVEMKIPFAAFRFPNSKTQLWRANFTRHIRRKREDANWNYYDATKLNYLSQFGTITGIEGIESPLRLSLFPYVSGYVDIHDQTTSTALNGGLDLKYGINDAFTLDMTLVPDFGQVRFDDQILNLSPYEVRFNEFRQFFTEGVEIFNKGDLFYSRRVGGPPVNGNLLKAIDSTEIIISQPRTTQLLNATKFSGRTKKGLGIGVFNGITNAEIATIKNTATNATRNIIVSPLTNYNLIVLDQNLNHNSSISLVNSNVWRDGHTYDANVTALLVDFYNKSEMYQITGNASNSQILKEVETIFGQKYNIGFNKVAGTFIAGINTEIIDNKFDSNDLGFLARNNYKKFTFDSGLRTYKGFWKFIRAWTNLNIDYTRLYSPNVFTAFQIYTEGGVAFKNFLFAGLNYTAIPIAENDYFEPRTNGLFYERPGGNKFGGFISSNYANAFAYDISASLLNRNEKNRYELSLEISPRYRFNDKLSAIFSINYNKFQNDVGLALTNQFDIININNRPVFGQRNREDIVNLLTVNYIFSNTMNIALRARHYWSTVTYSAYYVLAEAGQLKNTSYQGLNQDLETLHNNNFNIFTIDMTYSWVFAPGSFLSLVWKQSLSNSSTITDLNYVQNINELSQLPAVSSLSIKILYFLNYANITKFIR